MRLPCPLLLLVTLMLAGCPKRMERVAGTDDARIDAAEARLEELRLRAHEDEASCPSRCDASSEMCELADALCSWVESTPDRTDLPPRCVQAREQCAQATSRCTRCTEG
ncbi:hypothetical protein POL68_10640 [Stigmatella sp. ncwal1]|uniref:Lipoprotein n=1 Tax=Stigmatella ashevillensis TaxID=2995309 RepID=A0ABT5D783_9BACT|nr:hypothetical protein [Stigmatella ashevillena]MDC0708924.1 hypothetical protein [Stigmatella ashevillena]